MMISGVKKVLCKKLNHLKEQHSVMLTVHLLHVLLDPRYDESRRMSKHNLLCVSKQKQF